MEIEITTKAMQNLTEIAEYLDSINTLGAGSRWLDGFFERVSSYAKPAVKYPLCQNLKLAKKGLSCISYRKWVIAFKIYRGKFIIHEVVFGPILG
jgi:hypothetical protein